MDSHIGTGRLRRLAILDSGESAARVLAAVDGLGSGTGRGDVATVLVHAGRAPAPWYAREADEVLTVPPAPGGGVDAEATADALADAEIDLVWVSPTVCADLPGLVRALTGRGLTVAGPGADALEKLDGEHLAASARAAGLATGEAGSTPGAATRAFDVLVLRDAAGTAWPMGVVETSVRRHGDVVISELPAPALPAEAQESATTGALALLSEAGFTGLAAVHFEVDTASGTPVCTGVDVTGRSAYALLTAATGVNVVAQVLRLAAGESLAGSAPQVDGHSVEAALLAQDPADGFASSGGAVQL